MPQDKKTDTISWDDGLSSKKQKGSETLEKFPILVTIGTDTASKLGLSKSALYRLAHSAEGQQLTVRVGGRLLFKRDALLEFLGVNGKEE